MNKQLIKTIWHSFFSKVNVIGDSHVNFFSGNELIAFQTIIDSPFYINNCTDKLKDFTTYHIGGALAYNTNKYYSTTMVKEKVEYLIKKKYLRKSAKILCCFGEIDCRVYVYKYASTEGEDYKRNVDEIVSNYMEFLIELKSRGFDVYAWGPIPSQKDAGPLDPSVPYTGPEANRNRATEYFNQILEEKCKENGIGFVSIFKYLIDKNYKTKREYISVDCCHLSQRCWQFARAEILKSGMLGKTSIPSLVSSNKNETKEEQEK